MRCRSLTKHWRQPLGLCAGLVLFELQPSPPIRRPPPPQRSPQFDREAFLSASWNLAFFKTKRISTVAPQLKHSLICFLHVVVFTFAPLAWSADKDAAEPFTLTVVPSRSSPQGRSISFADDKPEEFYVVLTNSPKDA